MLIPTVLGLNRVIRNHIINHQKGVCGRCHTPFSKYVPPEIHRINGVKRDIRSSNLIALCSNCHSAHHRYNVSIHPYFDLKLNDHEKYNE